MPRSFTTNFKTQCARKNGAKPYCVLEIDWGGTTGTKYYLDRDQNSFNASGARLPSSGVDNSIRVMQWPSCSLSLKEGQIGSTDQTQVVLNDASGTLTAILNTACEQRKLVTLWRMFDDPSCVWGTDNAEIFTGVLRPFDWKANNNEITLNLGDLGPLLAKSISTTASASIFSATNNPGGNAIPTAQQDRQIPLCWGQAQRVEAICVQAPFETQITESISAGSGPFTVTIKDDPSDMGVDGTGVTKYSARLGTQVVTVAFTQSSTPGNGSSTATISTQTTNPLAVATCEQVVNGSGQFQLAIRSDQVTINDPHYGTVYTLDQYFTAGWPVNVVMHSYGTYSTTLVDLMPHEPFADNNGVEWYVIVLNDPQAIIYNSIQLGDTFDFMNPNTAIDNWPAGTFLQQIGVDSIYLANALPSKNIIKVEGFGTCTDSAGQNRKDFIPLGQYTEVYVSGSTTTTLTGNTIKWNLNDNTWNNPAGTKLGQDVTTVTFPAGTPRQLFNLPNAQTSLDDNRIWVTLDGVEDKGDSTGNLITNPATIILQYLENTHLMNVATGSINAAAFTSAASSLSSYFCGFGQVEAADGLSLLQHIAQLCHSFLFFDQGQASIVVMSDTAGAVQHTFDTTTNDNILQGSLTVSESSVDDIINDLTFKWRAYWDDKTGNKLLDSKNVKLTSIAAFGRMAREINPVDIYWRRSDVASERDWWLNHLSSIFRYVKFTGFLDALILQPGDWISVTWIDGAGRNYWNGAQTMMVTKTTDTGKDGLVEIEARYVEFSYT